MEVLQVIVTRQFFPKNGDQFKSFWAGEVQDCNTKKRIRVSGPVELIPKMKYNIQGLTETDPKWGDQKADRRDHGI